MLAKIHVAKQGDIYRVAVDPTSSTPLPIASYEDEPPGSFMQTYTDYRELQMAYPGREFIFLEKAKKAENVVGALPIELRRKADAMLSGLKLAETTPVPIKAVAVATEQVLSAPAQGNDVRLQRAQEFLKRLEMASEYASKKNKATLDIKIAAVKELIGEVFG